MLSLAGSPDLSFGVGGQASETSVAFTAKASVLQSDGDLVEVGTSYGADHEFDYEDWQVFAYDANGNIDATFSTTGLPAFSVSSGYEGYHTGGYTGATGVALESGGQLVVVGEDNGVAYAVRLEANGALDTSFGTKGIVTLGTVDQGDGLLDYAAAVAVLPGGLIAVGGSTTSTAKQDTPAVTVLNPDGSIDANYGTKGLAVAPLPANAQAFASIAPQLVSGIFSYDTPAGPFSMVEEPDGGVAFVANAALPGISASSEIVATRLTAAGQPDAAFGTGGQATITISATVVSGTALATDPAGDLFVGGAAFSRVSPSYGMLVEELTPAGLPDASFGPGGVQFVTSVTGQSEAVGAIAVQADGKIVLADQDYPDFTRLNADGSLDTSFGTDGQAVLYQMTPVLRAAPIVLSAAPEPVSMTSDLIPDGSVGLAIAANGKIVDTAAGAQYTINGGAFRLLGRGATGDYDGDGVSDPAVYITSSAVFGYVPSSRAPVQSILQFGIPGAGQDLPAPGAYGGMGLEEPAIYLPSLGAFAITSLQSGQRLLAPFGPAGPGVSLPAPGDYDKSGATELAVYDPATDIYAYRPAGGGADVFVRIAAPGPVGSIPVPADYFGTGQDDVAVYNPFSATFAIQDPANGQTYTIPFGIPNAGSIPVPGDYDGSGHAELAAYLPSLGELVYGPGNGGPTVVIPFGLAGAGRTLPAPGDYDGSGKTEVAAYFPTSALFAYRPASGGADVFFEVGTANQTVPFVLASATDVRYGGAVMKESVPGSASVEIPLTPDVLDAIAGNPARKKAGSA